MTRKTSEFAAIASINLLILKKEIIAIGDPEMILWALDQFRHSEALLRRFLVEPWPRPKADETPEHMARVRQDFRA
jgi:hypothetical protein